MAISQKNRTAKNAVKRWKLFKKNVKQNQESLQTFSHLFAIFFIFLKASRVTFQKIMFMIALWSNPIRTSESKFVRRQY